MNDKKCCNFKSFYTAMFNTRFNWSLIVLSGLVYLIFFKLTYITNQNYDRTVSWFNFSILFSGLSLLAKYISSNKREDMVAEYSVFSLLISLFTLLLAKSIFSEVYLVYYIAGPISFFAFFLVIQEIYNSAK